MQRGSDRNRSERTSCADDQWFDRGPGGQDADEDEDAGLTRACHDLAVANDAGQDRDPEVHDRPRVTRERE